MDLHTLEIFQAAAKLGSISKAARELKYAQSNITMKIQQLEKELQTTLFYRHNRGISLTAKGSLLLTYSEKILHLVEETQNMMGDNLTPKGPLRIGSMETTAAIRLPSIISKYHKNYPEVDLSLKTGSTEQSIQAVLQYELDGAFVNGTIDHPELIEKEVFEEELMLITDSSYTNLATLKDVPSLTILVFHIGCSYRYTLERWLKKENIHSYRIMEFGSLDAIIGCISAGLGISLLPKSIVSSYINKGFLSGHIIPDGKVKTSFIHRKDRYIPTSLSRFVELLNEDA